ncbi:hypothetical protein ABZ569_34100 [Streptomyces albus]|uniref:hypothetical protein n=1 Tax=Streptomyces albus TaxID=1888 RepID=UPI0033D0586C
MPRVREITDEHGWQYRVGDEVQHVADSPIEGGNGSIRRLYKQGGHWWAVVKWPHRRSWCRRIGLGERNAHPVGDLVPVDVTLTVDTAVFTPEATQAELRPLLADPLTGRVYLVGDQVKHKSKATTGQIMALYEYEGAPKAAVAWPIPGLSGASAIERHPLSELHRDESQP